MPGIRNDPAGNIILPVSLIIFDFDGVLADTLADMLRFAQEACDELGVKHTVSRADLSELEVMSFAMLGRACGTPEELVDEFVRRCTAKFATREASPRIFAGLAEVVRQLAESHALVVVTGNTKGTVEAFLKAHGLDGCFRAVYGLDMPGSKVEKILRAKDQTAAQAGIVYMVGDSLSDIHAAREADVQSIAVSWGHQSLERLMGAKPDYVARLPEDLLEIADGA